MTEIKEKKGFFQRLKTAIQGTRDNLLQKMEEVIQGKKEISPEMLDELEAVLIGADIGVTIAGQIIEKVKNSVDRKLLNDPEELREAIRQELLTILCQPYAGRQAEAEESSPVKPWVVMLVGVNGTGKTTTIGKLAHRYMSQRKSVLICAADTFRAAAVEQLAVWAERSGAMLVRQTVGGNPSSVIFDALQAGVSRQTDIVLVDTAGRLHTKHNLMQELEKMKRIAERQVPGAPHEVLLILDATTGQNGLIQAKEFSKAAGVSGLIVTKLDGTAKGGVVFSIVQEFKIPILYAGIGEKIDDLVDFSPEAFVDGIFR